jgi:hypothetical protein
VKNGLFENFFSFGSFAGLQRDYISLYLFLVSKLVHLTNQKQVALEFLNPQGKPRPALQAS